TAFRPEPPLRRPRPVAAAANGPGLAFESRLLGELLEEGILVRDVLLEFGLTHQIDPEAPRPPRLDVRPFRHELDVVLLIASGKADVLTQVVSGGIHEHPPRRRLDPDARFQRLDH